MNSRFFHTKASNRIRKNSLTSLQNATGVNLDGEVLDNHIVYYFQTLLSTNLVKGRMDFLMNMKPRITETVSADISRNFTEDEISQALKQMHLTKAFGPDRMPYLFFSCYWHIIGSFTFKSLLTALNSGQISSALTHTFITLIFKKKQP